jgi:hypothetical protein
MEQNLFNIYRLRQFKEKTILNTKQCDNENDTYVKQHKANSNNNGTISNNNTNGEFSALPVSHLAPLQK